MSMSIEVFESMEKLKKRLEGASFLESNQNRKKALEYYFSKRGIVQLDVEIPNAKWPALVYPGVEKLEDQIGELALKHKDQSTKNWNWQMTHLKASSKNAVAHVQKVTDPLYWKHVSKKITDSQYRNDARTIDLHSSLISDAKYRPMIDAFVHNEEYRKQLTETVKTSIVYKNHKGLAKHADDRKQLQMDVSKSLMGKTQEQVNETQKQIFALKELLKWGKESEKK